jgi:hypothetical protein
MIKNAQKLKIFTNKLEKTTKICNFETALRDQ